MSTASAASVVLDEARAWALLLELADRARRARPAASARRLALDSNGGLERADAGAAWIDLTAVGRRSFTTSCALGAGAAELLDLYLPLCTGKYAGRLCIAHVGQSLDGQIATASGASKNVTGPENIRHMHRLRALCDAVLVGAETVEADDPQLTTRLVPGENPTRVVIDPTLRSTKDRRLYRDGAAPTLILCSSACAEGAARVGHAEVVAVPCSARALAPESIIRTLNERGLGRLFVEGGGVTVSRFLQAGALSRLHVTISPIFIGSGSPGIVLSGIDQLDQARRPSARRFDLGQDVLFDCDFSAHDAG
ncbi:MAG TPA: RibD family protein [Polyangiaceae bacterium]